MENKVESIYFDTEHALPNNSCVMGYFIDHINTAINIYLVDGTYAEGEDSEGNTFEIHAGGNGDFFSHRIDFELISAAGE